tara:strand:+ start:68 stop:403 length:336 start_codon:yes stop_codon:yes gene_type:complete
LPSKEKRRLLEANKAPGDAWREDGLADVAFDVVEETEEEVRGGETASHTTPFAWCTPFLKDFSRRHSSPALPFQRLTGKMNRHHIIKGIRSVAAPARRRRRRRRRRCGVSA